MNNHGIRDYVVLRAGYVAFLLFIGWMLVGIASLEEVWFWGPVLFAIPVFGLAMFIVLLGIRDLTSGRERFSGTVISKYDSRSTEDEGGSLGIIVDDTLFDVSKDVHEFCREGDHLHVTYLRRSRLVVRVDRNESQDIQKA